MKAAAVLKAGFVHTYGRPRHLPREIPALMWKQQQSHLPGYNPGLQVILLTMTVILDLKEQCGRSLRWAPPPFKWNRIIGKKKNRQVCNYSNRSCFWLMHSERSQWRTELPGTKVSQCPSENPITPKRSKTWSSCTTSFIFCLQDHLKNPSPFLTDRNASYIAGMTKKLWILMQPEVLTR